MKTFKELIISSVLYCLLILQAIPVTAQSESGVKVSGTVTTIADETLPYVTVVLYSSSDDKMVKGTITSEEGFFAMENVALGDYYLSVSVIGYQAFKSASFTLVANEHKDFGSIKLDEESFSLGTVTVTGRKPLIQNKADRVVLNIENSILAKNKCINPDQR